MMFEEKPTNGTENNETEIGSSDKKVRRKRAISTATPNRRAPSSANTEPVLKPVRKRRARATPPPIMSVPDVSPIGPVSNGGVGGDGRAKSDTHAFAAISATVKRLVTLQRRRVFNIVEKNRSERGMEALLAHEMGFSIDSTPKERKAVYARAKAYRLYAEKHASHLPGEPSNSISELIDEILLSAQNRTLYVTRRKDVEAEMMELAKQLPVYEFAMGVAGFSALGLACLTGEAGIPMGDFHSVSALWKRMGLAVFGDISQYSFEDGKWTRHAKPELGDKRQQKCADKAEANLHGYNPRRRGEVYTFLSDTMFKHQWCGEKQAYRKKIKSHPAAQAALDQFCAETGIKPNMVDLEDLIRLTEPHGITAEARPAGPYGIVYANRRAHTASRIAETEEMDFDDKRKWTPKRCLKDACRVMSKALLCDLWRVWNGQPPRVYELHQ
jgi:hypothetical protein